MKRDYERQDHLRAPRRLPHKPTPVPTCKEATGDNGRQDHFSQPTPTPTQRETTGDHGRQDDLRGQKGYTPINTHPTWRETTGDKTTSEAKKATTRTNTHPHMKGDFRGQEGYHTNQHPPHRQPKTTGDKIIPMETAGHDQHQRKNFKGKFL